MLGDMELLLNARSAIDKARKRSSPIIFIKDEHPSSMRILGANSMEKTLHCLEDNLDTFILSDGLACDCHYAFVAEYQLD